MSGEADRLVAGGPDRLQPCDKLYRGAQQNGRVRVADRIEAAIHALAERPHGRRGRVKGPYEKSVTGLPYVIAYAPTSEPDGSETLNVLHVIHTRRNWPEGE